MKNNYAVYKGKVKDKYGRAVHLFYEYRGHEYMVTDEHNGYSDHKTMVEEHKEEQARIDREIEEASKPEKEYRYEDTAEYGFNLFWDLVEKGG